jgi:hypothetical protein
LLTRIFNTPPAEPCNYRIPRTWTTLFPASYSVVRHVPFDPRAHTTLQAYYSPAVAVAVAARARREWSHVSVEPAGCSPRAERGQPTEPTPARRSIVFRAGWLAVCVIPHAKPRERELLGPPARRRVLVRRSTARVIGAGTGGGAVRFGGCLQASARTRGCEPCNLTRSMDAGGSGTRRVSHRNRDVGETRLYPVQPFRWVIPVGRRISENPVKLLLALLACGACRTNLTDLRL